MSDFAIRELKKAGIEVGYDDMLSSFGNVQAWPAYVKGSNSVMKGPADGYHNFVDLLSQEKDTFNLIKIAGKMVLDAFSMDSLQNWNVDGPNIFTYTKGYYVKEFQKKSLGQSLDFMFEVVDFKLPYPKESVTEEQYAEKLAEYAKVLEGATQFFALEHPTRYTAVEEEITQKKNVYRSEIAAAIKFFPTAKFVFEASVSEEDMTIFLEEFGLQARRDHIYVSGGVTSDLSFCLTQLDRLME